MRNLSITLLLMTLILAASSFTTVLAQGGTLIPPGYRLQGDMILPIDSDDSGIAGTPWPGGVVPYAFDANVIPVDRAAALVALAEISAVANIRFVQRTTESDFLDLFDSGPNGQNNSFIGMIGGSQRINISSWDSKGVIIHEVMHALGYVHEQSRPDRGASVTIVSANICCNAGSNFDIFPGAMTAGPYDYLSLMHYGQYFFSNEPGILNLPSCNYVSGGTGPALPTILTTDPSFQDLIGQDAFMSHGDALGLATRYGPAIAPTVSNLSPNTAPTGSGAVTITVTGDRFLQGSLAGTGGYYDCPDIVAASSTSGVQGSRIVWNGTPLNTTFVSATQLTAQVPAALLAAAGCAQLRVENQMPAGGLSNALPFDIGSSGCVTVFEYQVNGAESSLTFDGVAGTTSTPAMTAKTAGTNTVLAISSTNTGLLWDAALAFSSVVPLNNGGIATPGGQTVNIDYSLPGVVYWNSGLSGAPNLQAFAGNLSLTFAAPASPAIISAQALHLSPSHADGFALSQAAQLNTTPAPQVFTSSPNLAIPDGSWNGNCGAGGSGGVSDTIALSSATTSISRLRVEINIPHMWVEDLYICLTAPNGTTFSLSEANGGDGDNYTMTGFTGSNDPLYVANGTIGAAAAPFTGTFLPDNVSAFNALYGTNPNGTWTLTLGDDAGGDQGTLQSWSITL